MQRLAGMFSLQTQILTPSVHAVFSNPATQVKAEALICVCRRIHEWIYCHDHLREDQLHFL